MDYKFAKRAQNIPESGIIAMMRYGAKYPDIISLGQGTPQFPTPSFIYDYVYERAKVDPKIGMYAETKIENELLELIRNNMEEIYGFKPEMNQLSITIGAVGGLFATFLTFLDEGDEVIYFDPSYPIHLSQLYALGAKPVFVAYDEKKNWSIDIEKLKAAVTPKTKMIILTNPNNPTGTVLSKEEIEAVIKVVLDNNLIILLDEAYEFLTYDKPHISPITYPEIRNNVVLCKSFSKEFAMTGWRVGYVYANENIIAKVNDEHINFSVKAPTPSITGVIGAMSDPRGHEAMEEFKRIFAESRKVICERLDRLPKLFSYNKPDGAFYVFPKYLNFDMKARDFARLLVDEAHVITIPGTSMGPHGEGHLRMSFATNPENINKAFDRIDEFAKKHNLL